MPRATRPSAGGAWSRACALERGQVLLQLRCSILRGHTSSVCCLLVNWELRLSMSAGLMDGLRLWSLESKQSVEAGAGS